MIFTLSAGPISLF